MAPPTPLANATLAARLNEVADLFENQDACPARVQAWRRAAAVVRAHQEPLQQVLRAQGARGLLNLPGIGVSLAHAIEQLVFADYLPLLERMRGKVAVAEPFANVVGIGPELARRIHEVLGIDTLYELEIAAHDGRLASVRGMGRARVLSVGAALAGRFRRGPDIADAVRLQRQLEAPSVMELLAIDQEYRGRAEQHELPQIAPRNPVPGQRNWLPVLHAERRGRWFTVLYAGGAATGDAVVIYRDDAIGDGQWVVASSDLGAFRGRRVVRGREAECRVHYRRADARVAAAARSEPGELQPSEPLA